MAQLGFFVNSDACSGCKTCQVACKDKNDLRAGTSWRRVYEVTAGGWQKKGPAWTTTVVAYNLSLACHHCFEPACTRNCTTEAIYKREDGLVLIDQPRCTKCNKCAADCPYDAIRAAGSGAQVSKCDFCADELAAGRPPVCVTACPNRALDWGEYDDLVRKYGRVNRVFPLADPAIARPALVIKPHRHAALVEARQPEISNWEEI
jgi:anaerobic dimethyl sulfoxide reductase subunit B